jgi:uncharacterized membrane protein YqjE
MKKILTFLFWWPIQAKEVLFEKTDFEKVNMACAFMSGAVLFALIFWDKGNYWAALATYILLGILPSKNDFWRS